MKAYPKTPNKPSTAALEARLAIAQRVGAHALQQSRRLAAERIPAEHAAWLTSEPQRLAAWLELTSTADIEGRISWPAELLAWRWFNARQRRYFWESLRGRGLVLRNAAGEYILEALA